MRQFHPPAGQSDRESARVAFGAPVRQEILNGALGLDIRYDERALVSSDRSVGFYYGTRGLRETERGGLDFGGGLKFLSSSRRGGGKAGLKPALDLGSLWRFGDRHAAGVSLLNFGGAKFAGGDRAPLAIKFSFAEQLRGMLITADATAREPSPGLDGRLSFATGFERWWATPRAGQFALRSGLSLGSETKTWSWGLGWRALGARLDYAMIVPLAGLKRLGHGVSLSLRFGRSDPEGEYEKLLAQELQYRRQLSQALEASSMKQWKLAEELSRMREELAALRAALDKKRADETEARRKMSDLEVRHKKAVESFEKVKAETSKTKSALFQEDWRAYQRAKLSGAPDAALVERVSRLLREYKDSGADLAEANQELRRLQQAAP
jgi:hypothetical protein